MYKVYKFFQQIQCLKTAKMAQQMITEGFLKVFDEKRSSLKLKVTETSHMVCDEKDWKTCPLDSCGQKISKSNFFRHLQHHRFCTFCSEKSGVDIYHSVKNLCDCPFYEHLLQVFYPRFGNGK